MQMPRFLREIFAAIVSMAHDSSGFSG